MSYTALYRKFRPATFEDVKGQEHIVKTIKNQINSGRIGHAYLFCGTRGTGKTTIAKIVAKAVNCEHPVDGSPCGECATCKAIAAGTAMNVVEIDAASNNSVDNIREIVDDVRYSPTEGKYRVYIIDEVHMLSTGAFNALLKTLEEPPEYVIFILATTEVQKIPVTILSRCQRYDFKRLTVDEISERLRELMAAEKIEAEEKAVRYIAVCADGAMRDALSLLDRCVAYYIGEKLTYKKVLEAIGTVDTAVFGSLMSCILSQDVTGALKIIEDIIVNGRELTQFTKDFTWYMRNMLLVKTSADLLDTLEIQDEHKQIFLENAEKCSIETLMRYIRVFSDLSNQIRFAQQKRVSVEIAIIKMCKPEMETDVQSLKERISKLEDALANGNFVTGPASQQSSMGNSRNTQKEEAEQSVIDIEKLEKATSEDMKLLAEKWPEVLAKYNGFGKQMLAGEGVKKIIGDGNILVLNASYSLDTAFLTDEKHIKELKDVIIQTIGKEIEVKVNFSAGKKQPADEIDYLRNIRSKVKVEEVEKIEE